MWQKKRRMVKKKCALWTASLSDPLNREWSFPRLEGIFFHCGWSRINLKQSSNDYKLQTNFYLACCDKDYWKIGSLTNDELSNIVHTKITQNHHPDFWPWWNSNGPRNMSSSFFCTLINIHISSPVVMNSKAFQNFFFLFSFIFFLAF